MRPALAGALALAACSSPARFPTNVPAGAEWVALIEVDAAGGMVRASPLLRWQGDAFPIFGAGDTTLIIQVYTGDQVAAVNASATPEQITSTRLTLAIACEPKLPDPIRAYKYDGTTLMDAPQRFALTAPWLETTCASDLQLYVDATCSDVRCPVEIVPRGCGFDVDLSSCGLGTANGAPVGDDGLCVLRDDPQPACELRWYRGSTPPLAQKKTTIDLLVEAHDRWNPPGDEGPIDPALLAQGYAWDLAPLGDVTLVSTPGDTPLASCALGVPGVIAVIDQTAVVGRAPAPPCLLWLASDLDAGKVGGVFASGDGWMLGYFDRAGVMTASAAASARTADSRPIDLVRTGTSWIAAFRRADGGGTTIIAYDDALHVTARSDLDAKDYDQLGPGESGEVLLTERGTNRYITATPGRGILASARLSARSGEAARILYRPRAGLIATGVPSVLRAQDDRAVIFDADTRPIFAIDVASDAALVFGLTDDRRSTLTTFVDRRFRPDTQPLSAGPVSRAALDRDGNVWALAPWTGEVLFID